MHIKRYLKNGCQIFRVTEDVSIRNNISELKPMIMEYLEKGIKQFALAFTPNSFLNSASVSVCVQCIEMANEHSARMCIIRPNEQILDVLKITGLLERVAVVDSEEMLGAE